VENRIVDDDEDVHRSTRFALQQTTILNRPLEFIHTYSKAETRQLFPPSAMWPSSCWMW
jgi:hypothetical protein